MLPTPTNRAAENNRASSNYFISKGWLVLVLSFPRAQRHSTAHLEEALGRGVAVSVEQLLVGDRLLGPRRNLPVLVHLGEGLVRHVRAHAVGAVAQKGGEVVDLPQ